MGDIVRIVYRKYDGSLHWHTTMRRLGEDEHGVWTGAQAMNVSHKGDGPPFVIEHEQVRLFPRDAWWTASFNAEPARTEIYCDISTRPVWPATDEVTMVDLDLDVCRRRRDGAVVLLDADEFAEHQVKYHYPATVITASKQSAAWLMRAIGDGSEPFASTYQAYLKLLADGR